MRARSVLVAGATLVLTATILPAGPAPAAPAPTAPGAAGAAASAAPGLRGRPAVIGDPDHRPQRPAPPDLCVPPR